VVIYVVRCEAGQSVTDDGQAVIVCSWVINTVEVVKGTAEEVPVMEVVSITDPVPEAVG
jgi:hypothetical protein